MSTIIRLILTAALIYFAHKETGWATTILLFLFSLHAEVVSWVLRLIRQKLEALKK